MSRYLNLNFNSFLAKTNTRMRKGTPTGCPNKFRFQISKKLELDFSKKKKSSNCKKNALFSLLRRFYVFCYVLAKQRSGTCWDTFHFRVHISLLLYHHFYDYEMLKNSSIVFFTSNAETNCIGELMALFSGTPLQHLYNYLLPLETHSNFCFRIQWILGYWISTTLRLTR